MLKRRSNVFSHMSRGSRCSYSQSTEVRTLSASQDTGGDARGWDGAGRGIGGCIWSTRIGGGVRALGVNRADEESGESDVLDQHYREGVG